ncbi:C-Jun-amino-terminal kinase-interacting protein 1-like [Glandiceps talaboti]
MTPEHKRCKPKQPSDSTHLHAEMIKLDIMDSESEPSDRGPKQMLNIFKEESEVTGETKFFIEGTDDTEVVTTTPRQKKRNGRQLPKIPVPATTDSLQAEIEQAEKKEAEVETDKQAEYGHSPIPPEVTVIPTDSPGFQFDSTSRENKPMLSAGNLLLLEDSSPTVKNPSKSKLSNLFNKNEGQVDGSPSKKKSGFTPATLCINGVIRQQTHLTMFRFLTRHDDEIELDIGDPVYVEAMCADLWYEGVNLRSGAEGCFPSVYVREVSEETETEPGLNGRPRHLDKFLLKFLGSSEVIAHKGNDVLCKAMQKIVTARRMTITSSPPTLCLLEISVRGIRMTDQSKPKLSQKKESVRKKMGKILGNKGDRKSTHNHFFTLKNVSFCGYHPKNDRYFGFITKHPSERRFACHVFIADEGQSSKPVAEAFGRAFRSFYDEFLEYTHPTEDIYME